MKIGIIQFDRVQVMSLGDQKIFPTIIIVVEEANAPSRVKSCDAPQIRIVGHIGKSAVAVISVQGVHLIGEIGDQEIGQAVVVVVGEVHSHARVSTAVSVGGDAGGDGTFTYVTYDSDLGRITRFHSGWGV